MTVAPPSGWAVPEFPHPPQDSPELLTVDDAYLTRMRKGRLRTVQRPDRWITGAVHDAEGRLVRISQKLGGLGGNQLVMADPERVAVRDGAERLPGAWFYGGHWIDHFGHFVTETLTTLWPRRADVGEPAGVVFHAYGRHREVAAWERELFDLTEYAGLPVRVVTTAPVRVDRLVVPSRSVVVNGWAHDGARAVWQHMVGRVGGAGSLRADGPRVFLSRTGFNARLAEAGEPTRTDAERDRALDAIFAAAGFDVVEPERLPVADQIRLAAGASVLAGCAGTALHLSAFAPEGVRVLEIGDSRSPDGQVPHQQVLDRLLGHPTAFVPAAVATADLPALLAGLGL